MFKGKIQGHPQFKNKVQGHPQFKKVKFKDTHNSKKFKKVQGHPQFRKIRHWYA